MVAEPVPWFEVHHIATEEPRELNTFVLGLPEREDGDGETLIFEIPLAPFDEQDRGLGMDTYCLSTADGATDYGGLTRCILQADALSLQLQPEAAGTPRPATGSTVAAAY